ncbi:MAG: hypothetical protein MJ007_01545 [Paludibacteraceae bacterium]|nr:hypothetical protein [Paludibacteraceae bacterium]
MPYRRLPNTDAARLRAMQTASKQYESLGINVPFQPKTIHEINALIPQYERAIEDFKYQSNAQATKNKKYQNIVKTARMYISHFIQVLNLSCIRNEIKPEKKLLYKLLPTNFSVPDLSTEALILEWGKNIIDGENERIMNGGAPIYNPAIAKVRVNYEIFKDEYQLKKIGQKNSDRALGTIKKIRETADSLILELWNQIESHYKDLGTVAMQEEAKKFGVVYYLRRKEKQALQGGYVDTDDDVIIP